MVAWAAPLVPPSEASHVGLSMRDSVKLLEKESLDQPHLA